MNLPHIPTFVISLEEATDRREWMNKQLSEIGINFEFFNAIDGRKFDVPNHPSYDKNKRLKYFGRNMKGGEIGCLLSHRGIYEKIINDNLDMALILEDDVVLKGGFKQAITELTKIGDKFDVVRFLGSPKVAKHKNRKVAHLFDDFWMVRIKTTPGGTHAYIVTNQGAKKLLKHMDKNYLPVDTLVGHAWKTGAKSYIVQPGLATQDLTMESSIGEERFDKSVDLKGFQKTIFPITRAWFKFSEAIGKSWVWYSNYFKEKLNS